MRVSRRPAAELHGHGELLRVRHRPVFERDVYRRLRPDRGLERI